MLPRSIFSLAGITLLAVAQASAADVLMSHKNATVGVNTNGTVASWTIDGVNQLAGQSLFYRVGRRGRASRCSPEYPRHPAYPLPKFPTSSVRWTLPTPTPSYSVRTLFQLTGSTAGSGKANFNQTLGHTEPVGRALWTFTSFQYSNFDLGGVAAWDKRLRSILTALLQPYKIVQTDGVRTVTETVNANTAPIGHLPDLLCTERS
jgi:hypothetical protein